MVPRTIRPQDRGIEAVHQAQMGRFGVVGVCEATTRQPTAVHCQCFTRPHLRGTVLRYFFCRAISHRRMAPAWPVLTRFVSNIVAFLHSSCYPIRSAVVKGAQAGGPCNIDCARGFRLSATRLLSLAVCRSHRLIGRTLGRRGQS